MASLEFQNPTLLLEQFPAQNQELHVLGYAGGGTAGYVFKVLIGEREYALKMFKFDNTVYPYRLKGVQRQAVFDTFYIECRANSSLIAQKLNGKFTPLCYGWIYIPTQIELYLASKFNKESFLWDRPPDSRKRVRAILYEWVEGKMLYQVPVNAEISNQIRSMLEGLHQASMAHRDIRAANILVKNDRVYLIDLNSSWTLCPEISLSKLKEAQESDRQDLEIGFVLLSQTPINQGVCVANMSLLGQSSLDEVLTTHELTKCHWQTPAPSYWHNPV